MPKVLATDLDGTLIPLEGASENIADLKTLSRQLIENDVRLVFVTGRHLASTLSALIEFELPMPEAIISDVGTTISVHDGISSQEAGWNTVDSWSSHLAEVLGRPAIGSLADLVADVEGARLQEPFKQGPFKLSFYTDADRVSAIADSFRAIFEKEGVACSVIDSIDPFNNDGLIDCLPKGVSKAYALDWWISRQHYDRADVAFSGDSGNDLAALTAGYRAIVVGNASDSLKQKVQEEHRRPSLDEAQLFIADQTATSGVLAGCRHHGLFA